MTETLKNAHSFMTPTQKLLCPLNPTPISKLEAVLGQLQCEVHPPLSLVSTSEQNGSAKNVSLATVFLHSNQAKFHVKLHSAPETEQNEPNFKSLS